MKLSQLFWMAIVGIAVAGCESGPDVPPTPEEDLRSMSIPERRDRFDDRADDAVGYSNPRTGYTADYTLDVEYSLDGSVERINFPNGGWLDDFADQTDNGDGTITVETYDGREFTVPSDPVNSSGGLSEDEDPMINEDGDAGGSGETGADW